MRDQATIDRIYAWADKQRQRYQDRYQMDGTPSAMRTFEKYDDICDICIAAEKGIADEDKTRKHIHSNQVAMLASLEDLRKVAPNKTFGYDDVKNWMRKMMV